MVDTGRVQRMHAAGFTNRAIARELGCSHTRIAQILARTEPIPIQASVSAHSDGTVVITSTEPQIVGALINRALRAAGVSIH